MSPFSTPIIPWPSLAPYARRVALPISGVTLHVYEAGHVNAPPLMLIHGLGDDADTWRHLLPRLAKWYHVVALDLPGFGRSDKPPRAYTVPFFRDVIWELMDMLGIDRAVLVGHSMGAVIGQSVALAYPERVTRLVLIGGSLVARRQRLNAATMLFLIPRVGEGLYNRLRRDPQAAYRTLAPYYADLASLDETERRFLYQRVNQRVWDDAQRDAFLSALRNLARTIPGQQKALAEKLPTLDIPTTIIWGVSDRVNALENGHALADLQANARLVVLPNAGHNCHHEQPDAIYTAIAAHL